METHPLVVCLISLLCSLYTFDGKLSDMHAVIQSNASNPVNFD